MSKTSGLGDNFYVGGYNFTGDISALSKISGSVESLEITGLTSSAHERLGGKRTGEIIFNTYFNTDVGQEHAALKTLPTTDVHMMYCRGTTLGNPSACLVAKQINYDPTRAADGSLTFAVTGQSNAFGLEWGNLLTAGARTDTVATNGTGVDLPGTNCLVLAGGAGNYANTPDTAALDVAGDIDIVAKIAADDWSPAADSYVVSKYNVTGNQRSYALILASTGALSLQWSNDGTASLSSISTVTTLSALGVDDVKWVRGTLDVDNGAAGHTVTFYTSDDGVTWTQYGAAVVTAGTTSIFSSTADLELGARNAGAAGNFAGRVFEAIVKSGIAGSEVAHPVAGASSITDATGLTWTLHGTALMANQTNSGWQAYVQVFSITGTSVTVSLEHSDDNSSFSAITGGAFTAVASPGPGTQRLVGASTAVVKRYVRAVTTGTFSNAVFAVTFVKNTQAVTF